MPIEIRMPQISMTMIDGTIVKWLKKEGEPVSEGEPLVEIQTDKVVNELASSASGILRTITAPEGTIVPIDGVLCIVGAEGESASPTPQGSAAAAPAAANTGGKDAPPDLPPPAAEPSRPSGGEKGPRVRATPLARKIAARMGLDLAGIQGTGPGGLIVKADLPAGTAGPVPSAPSVSVRCDDGDTVVPFEGIRKVIADNLMQSKRFAADVTTVADVCMDKVREIRALLPVSYTTFVVLAAGRALAEYPVVNALVEESRVIMKRDININVAVATKAGLLTPVIREVDKKNLLTVAGELADLSGRGRAGRLALEDFSGGTFTVTNSGVFGSVLFTPIINHPQSAVLGIGRIAMTPVVRAGAVVPALMMYLSLTYNHRSIDGETGVTFLQRIRHYLENPLEMIGV